MTGERSSGGESGDGDGPSRRRLLRAVSAAAAAPVLAGCQTNFDDDGTTATTTTDTTTTTTAGTGTTTTTTSETTTTATPGPTGATAGSEECPLPEKRAPGPDCNAPQRLDFNVTEDVTIGETCNQYVVDRDVTVRATLRIEPGTVIRFEADTGIDVRPEGAIVADGTCDEPIAFTGTNDQRGHWGSIAFDGSTGNRLRFCVVEYGGADVGGPGPKAAVAATAGGSVAIENCTLRESVSYGLGLRDGARLRSFEDNVLTRNTLGAATVDPLRVAVLTPANRYEGNDEDVVHVPGSTVPAGETANWRAVGVPFRVDGTLGVEGELVVGPGVVGEFAASGGLSVRGGRLSVDGEDGNEVVLTGAERTRGHWKGVHVRETESAPTSMANCVIEYAGGEPFEAAERPGNLVVTGTSGVSLRGCTLRESDGYGLVAGGAAELVAFRGNALTRNRKGAAAVGSALVPEFTTSNTYSGNAVDVVDVTVGGPIPSSTSRNWAGIDADYRIRGDLTVRGELSVAGGTTLQFTPRSSLQVDGGRLVARGSESAPIEFTGSRQQPGIWQGLLFASAAEASVMEHCTVTFAGSNPFSSADRPGSVAVVDGGTLSMDSCVVRSSNGYGVVLGQGARLPSFEDNDLRDNAAGPAFVRLGAVRQLSSTTSYAGNDQDRVFVLGGSAIPAGQDHTWEAIGVPYHVEDDLTVRGRLELRPGVTVAFRGGNGLLVRSGGTLAAAGNPDRGITLTATTPRKGAWNGVYFENSPPEDNRLHYCRIEYGGGETFVHSIVPANVAVTTGSFASVQNCRIESSAGYGLHATSSATVETSGNRYDDNESGDTSIR